jgi:alpha-L-rhamnosidase
VDSWGGFGDWLSMDNGEGSVQGATPKDLIGTAFYAYDAMLMSRIAHALGKDDDARSYAKLHKEIAAAFRRRFVSQEGLTAGHTQTAYVLALHFDLLEDDQKPVATEELVRNISQRGMHLSTGFVGSPYLNFVLCAQGRQDIAFQLLEQKTWPSWLYAVTQGATTIWERWDGWTHDKGFAGAGMNSFNHYAYGAIGAWLYAYVAGLDLDWQRPGGRHLLLQPHPGGSLTHARAVLDTPCGQAGSSWSIADKQMTCEVTIPPSSSAKLSLPALPEDIRESQAPLDQNQDIESFEALEGQTRIELPAGRYTFVLPAPESVI